MIKLPSKEFIENDDEVSSGHPFFNMINPSFILISIHANIKNI